MNPSAYVPAYLKKLYVSSHPNLTPAAEQLVDEQIAADPTRFVTTSFAQALLTYAQIHANLMDGLRRLDDVDDTEFEQSSQELFEQTRAQVHAIWTAEEGCVDAHLLEIQLSNAPLEDCLHNMMQLEQRVRTRLLASRPNFNPDRIDPFRVDADPELIGWLHINEALSQGCIFTARYRAAARYAHSVMRAQDYPNFAIGTLLLALARLEDEQGFFEAAHHGGDEIENSPWFLFGRTLLLYKLGQHRSARRALRDFSARCEGGAYFLLNPTYHNPYLPVRPEPHNPWELTHQAMWEADGIISDTPGFTDWAASVEGIPEAAEEFARRFGF